jgi:hypothetical protein
VTTTLLTDRIWPTLTAAASKGTKPAVAVAYFGQGAAKLLPLQKGSQIVVDASENAVKSGQTCPAELIKLFKRGVRVYSRKNLHAKVFVFGTKAFVGSANVSRYSANTLREAIVVTTDRSAVTAARKFVREMCVQEIGPEMLTQLAKLYRPPRLPGGGGRRGPKRLRGNTHDLPRVRLAQLSLEDPPAASEEAQEAGRKLAVRSMHMPRRHQLEDFWWIGNYRAARGDIVVQVVDEGGAHRIVSPPGTVVKARNWRRGERKLTFIYLEVPKQRRMSLPRLAGKLGYGWKKRLHRGGRLKRDLAQQLLQAWQE